MPVKTRKLLKATEESYQSVPDHQERSKSGIEHTALNIVREHVLYSRAFVLLEQDEETAKSIQAEVEEAKRSAKAVTSASSSRRFSQARGVSEYADMFEGSEKHLQNANACLLRMKQLWKDLSDDKFDDENIKAALSLGGSKPADFLQSMVVKINKKTLMKGRWWQWKRWVRLRVEQGDLSDSVGDPDNTLDKVLPPSKDKKSLFSTFFGIFIKTTHKVEYEAYWCGVKGLFGIAGSNPTRYMMILGELKHAEPQVFETVIAQAIVRHHWNIVFNWGFCVDRLLDITSILCLYWVTDDTHFVTLPQYYPIYGLMFISAVSGLNTIASFIQCYVMYKSIALIMTFWTVIFLVIDVLTFAVFLNLSRTTFNPFSDIDRTAQERIAEFATSWFAEHPVVLPFLIAGRWAYLLLALLNLEIIGQSILPVWEAARSRQSVIFLTYLLLGTAACAHSYFAFPIDDIDNILMAFFRAMRLTFLGDFDMFELQGVDDQIQIRNATGLMAAVHGDVSTNGMAVAGIDEDDQDASYMKGIRGWALMWAFIGPVIFMNIYIGLLGSAYEEARAQIEALNAKFRISTLMMLLLRRFFCEQVLHKPCQHLSQCFKMLCFGADPPNYVELAGDEAFTGYWIALPKSLTDAQEDVEDISEKMDEASTEIRELKEGMARIEHLLVESLKSR